MLGNFVSYIREGIAHETCKNNIIQGQRERMQSSAICNGEQGRGREKGCACVFECVCVYVCCVCLCWEGGDFTLIVCVLELMLADRRCWWNF